MQVPIITQAMGIVQLKPERPWNSRVHICQKLKKEKELSSTNEVQRNEHNYRSPLHTFDPWFWASVVRTSAEMFKFVRVVMNLCF